MILAEEAEALNSEEEEMISEATEVDNSILLMLEEEASEVKMILASKRDFNTKMINH